MPDIPHILLTSVNNLGDCVLFLPVVAAARAAFPQGRIILLTGAAGADAARLTGLPDDVLPLPPSRRHPPRAALLRLLPRLRRERFDLGVMASGDSSFVAALLRLSGARERAGFDDCAARFLLTRRVSAREPEHEARRNLRLASALGWPVSDARPPCGIPSALREEARTLLTRAGAPPEAGPPVVLIHPGASAPSRRWPAERFAALAAALVQEGRGRPVIIEGPAEPGLADEVARAAGIPLVALPTLRRVELLAALLAHSALFIGHSSGPFHVACLVGTRTVSLWGDTDPALWGPAWDPERHAVVRSPRPCAPCERWSPHGHRILRGKTSGPGAPCAECMAAIPEEVVRQAVDLQMEALSHQGR